MKDWLEKSGAGVSTLLSRINSLTEDRLPVREESVKPSEFRMPRRPSKVPMGAGGNRGRIWLAVVLFALSPFHFDSGGKAEAASRVDPDGQKSGNWPNFRGPGANGHAIDADPPLTWGAENGNNIRWKTKVPKPGLNSPVVWNDRVFLAGADDLSRQIYCFQSDTGKFLWKHEVDDIPGSPSRDELPEVMEEPGLSAPSLTTNGHFIAAIFATGDLVCAQMDGTRVWARNLGIPENHYGHASSLLSHGGTLFVQYDQNKYSKLLAIELASGQPVWAVQRGPISWTSPILIDNRGRMELILTNNKAVDSYDPQNGKLLWHMPGLNTEVAPSPAYADGVVYIANEYAVAAAIDISNHDSEPQVRWVWDGILPDAASLLASKDFLLVPSSYGIVTCLDTTSGKALWEHEFEEGFYSSPILAHNKVYITDLTGTTQIFKLGKTFELLGTATIGEEVYATPAYVGTRIYLRGVEHLFCIEDQ